MGRGRRMGGDRFPAFLGLPPQKHSRGNQMVRARGLAVLIAATFVAFACGGSTGSDTSKGEISIGVDLPISGAEGSQGLPTLNGVKYAVQLKGSVSGFKLTIDAK